MTVVCRTIDGRNYILILRGLILGLRGQILGLGGFLF